MKEVFFRNAFSAVGDYGSAFGRVTLPLQFALTSSSYDEFPVILGGSLAYYFTHGIFVVFGTLAKMVQLRAWYLEYTPQSLRDVAESRGTRIKQV